jgi:beta-glucosidase
VGVIALTLRPVPAPTPAAAHVEAASRVDGYHNRWFLDPLLRGAYPPDMLEHFERRFGPLRVIEEGDLEVIAEPIDFLGVNYYCPARVRAGHARTPLKAETLDPQPPVTAMGWEIDPEGLREVLLRVHREYTKLPLYITENGAAFDDVVLDDGSLDDRERVDYLEHHLAALSRAIADGVDVRRYCLWSLLDNFEWEQGYEKRFGIVHVDFDTQSRVPKRSGLWYRDYIARVRDGH